MAFVHLRTHTEYSVVDGTLRIDDAIGAAAADGQGALAITDLSNLFGAVKFYGAARRAGVKPIVGADLWLEPDVGERAPIRIVVLSQNRQGSKDRLRADLDYQVNLKNELALSEVLRRLDVLESERLPLLFAEQNERLVEVRSTSTTAG